MTMAQASDAPRDASAGHHSRSRFPRGRKTVLREGGAGAEPACATSLSFRPFGGRGAGAPRNVLSSCSSLKPFMLLLHSKVALARGVSLRGFVAIHPSPGEGDT